MECPFRLIRKIVWLSIVIIITCPSCSFIFHTLISPFPNFFLIYILTWFPFTLIFPTFFIISIPIFWPLLWPYFFPLFDPHFSAVFITFPRFLIKLFDPRFSILFLTFWSQLSPLYHTCLHFSIPSFLYFFPLFPTLFLTFYPRFDNTFPTFPYFSLLLSSFPINIWCSTY